MRRKSILNSDFILLHLHIPTNNTFKKIEKSTYLFPTFFLIVSTVAAVEISDRKDLNTLYKFRNLISVNRIFIKDYKVSVSI
jgi:hypothetical protein